jgi:small subunit ribosomal protein S11
MEKEKEKKKDPSLGIAYAHCTSNNTKVTITNEEGDVLAWSSGGLIGFKGSKRSTSYAAQAASENVGEQVYKKGIRKVHVLLKGIGRGRFAIAKGLRSTGLKVYSISDNTPLPHNGCRPSKRRRI